MLGKKARDLIFMIAGVAVTVIGSALDTRRMKNEVKKEVAEQLKNPEVINVDGVEVVVEKEEEKEN